MPLLGAALLTSGALLCRVGVDVLLSAAWLLEAAAEAVRIGLEVLSAGVLLGGGITEVA